MISVADAFANKAFIKYPLGKHVCAKYIASQIENIIILFFLVQMVYQIDNLIYRYDSLFHQNH